MVLGPGGFPRREVSFASLEELDDEESVSDERSVTSSNMITISRMVSVDARKRPPRGLDRSFTKNP